VKPLQFSARAALVAAKQPSARRALDLDFQELVGAEDFSDLTSQLSSGDPLIVAAYPAR